MERTNEKIKIILTNGFKYEGYEESCEDGFICLKDSKDGIKRKFPNSSISVIEVGQ